MSRRMEGRVAVVTGASRGIGRAIAERLGDEGAHVVLVSRKAEGLEDVRRDLSAGGRSAFIQPCHMGRPDEIDAMMRSVVEQRGRVDVLINNAATNPYFGPLIDQEWAAWDKTFEVNVKGYFSAARAFARHVQDRGGGGSIVNVTSVLGLMGAPLQGVYGMTKAAVISMTKTLAVEWAGLGIRVNAIAPGIIDTRFSQAMTQSEAIAQPLLERTPLQRFGRPEEVAELALHLAGDGSSYTTGAVFTVDGGLTVT
ncbi:MAG: glucose 1-dehydrogenase [Myxococcota bacterium]